MSKTEVIVIRINEQLKEDYKKAIEKDRWNNNMTADILEHIKQKVKRSGILDETED